jgi:small conductance mechanosensitive channel
MFMIILSLIMSASSGSGAQDLLSGVEADSLGNRAADLVGRVKSGVDRSKELQMKLASAGREDSLVLEQSLFDFQLRGLEDLHELTVLLVDLEKKRPREELRAEVEAAYDYITPRLWLYIERVTGQIDRARNSRHAVGTGDRPALEDDIAILTDRLDKTFELVLAHVEMLDRLGLESSGANETLKSMLSSRSSDLSYRIAFALKRIDYLSARLENTPDDADLKVLLVAAHASLETNTRSMSVTLDVMDSLKLPTKELRAQLTEATRDISSVILDAGAAVSLISRATGRLKSWLVDSGPGLIVKIALFIALVYIFRILSRLARKGTTKALDASTMGVSTLLRRMIITTVANVVMILGLLIALTQLGIDLTPLLAGLGVVGFIVGFALQDTLGNFASGMMILIYRPFDVGDLVEVVGVFGKVNKMSLVSTTILTFDNKTIIVPNTKIWGDVIKNMTAQNLRRVDLYIGISYSEDIPKAERVLMEILEKHEMVLDDPAPRVILNELADSSVNFHVWPWVRTEDYYAVFWDVMREVKMRFDEEGITIPFPQRDVHLYREDSS